MPNATHNRNRHGAVLLEFAMIIPLLAMIIGVTLFYGRALMHQQKVRNASRYDAWSRAKANAPTEGDLVQHFLGSAADNVSVSGTDVPEDAQEELVIEAGNFDPYAYTLASGVIPDPWPGGIGRRVSAEFPSDVRLYQMFQGPIQSRHLRDRSTWTRSEVSYLENLRDDFLYDLHNAVLQIEDPTLRANLRAMYEQRW